MANVCKSERVSTKRETERFKEMRGSNRMKIGKKNTGFPSENLSRLWELLHCDDAFLWNILKEKTASYYSGH